MAACVSRIVMREIGEFSIREVAVLICSWSALAEPYVLTASVFCPAQVTVLEMDAQAMRECFEENYHMGFRILQNTNAVASQRFKDTRIQLLSMVAK